MSSFKFVKKKHDKPQQPSTIQNKVDTNPTLPNPTQNPHKAFSFIKKNHNANQNKIQFQPQIPQQPQPAPPTQEQKPLPSLDSLLTDDLLQINTNQNKPEVSNQSDKLNPPETNKNEVNNLNLNFDNNPLYSMNNNLNPPNNSVPNDSYKEKPKNKFSFVKKKKQEQNNNNNNSNIPNNLTMNNVTNPQFQQINFSDNINLAGEYSNNGLENDTNFYDNLNKEPTNEETINGTVNNNINSNTGINMNVNVNIFNNLNSNEQITPQTNNNISENILNDDKPLENNPVEEKNKESSNNILNNVMNDFPSFSQPVELQPSNKNNNVLPLDSIPTVSETIISNSNNTIKPAETEEPKGKKKFSFITKKKKPEQPKNDVIKADKPKFNLRTKNASNNNSFKLKPASPNRVNTEVNTINNNSTGTSNPIIGLNNIIGFQSNEDNQPPEKTSISSNNNIINTFQETTPKENSSSIPITSNNIIGAFSPTIGSPLRQSPQRQQKKEKEETIKPVQKKQEESFELTKDSILALIQRQENNWKNSYLNYISNVHTLKLKLKNKRLELERLQKNQSDLINQEQVAIEENDFEKADRIENSVKQISEAITKINTDLEDTSKDIIKAREKEIEIITLSNEENKKIMSKFSELKSNIQAKQKKFNNKEMSQHQIEDLKLQKLKEKLDFLKTNLDTEKNFIDVEESKLNEIIKGQSKDIFNDLDDLNSQKSSIEEEILQIKHQLEEKENELAELHSKIDAKEQEIEAIKSTYSHDFSKIGVKKKNYTENLKDYQYQSDLYSKNYDSFIEEGKKYEVILQNFSSEIENCEKFNGEMEIKVNTKLEEIEHKKGILDKEKSAFESLSKCEEKLQQNIAELKRNQEEIQNLNVQNKFLQSEITQIEIHLPALEESKKGFVSSKNFKEAGRVSKELKSLLEKKVNNQNTIQSNSERIDKIEKIMQQLGSNKTQIEANKEEIEKELNLVKYEYFNNCLKTLEENQNKGISSTDLQEEIFTMQNEINELLKYDYIKNIASSSDENNNNEGGDIMNNTPNLLGNNDDTNNNLLHNDENSTNNEYGQFENMNNENQEEKKDEEEENINLEELQQEINKLNEELGKVVQEENFDEAERIQNEIDRINDIIARNS